MRITRYGHSALLIDHDDSRVLIDPGVFSVADIFELGELSAIVITHQHPDHVDRQRIGGLVERNPDAVLVADPETAGLLGGDWQANAAGTTFAAGSLTLTGAGAVHAEILPAIARVSNVGVLVSAAGQPTVFHPGDSYETVPEDVDVLALPLAAPWAKVSETVGFASRVAAGTAFPIHDATIAEVAYGVYWGHVENFSGVEQLERLGRTDSLEV